MKAMMNYLIPILITFVVIGVLALAAGISFGSLNLIKTTLNGTLTIPANFENAINTVSDLAGTGFIIAGAVGIIALVFVIIYIFYPSGGGKGGY